ncbi:hypothetical protein H1C71_041583, partial [Ictidomys tridecemlineatus]
MEGTLISLSTCRTGGSACQFGLFQPVWCLSRLLEHPPDHSTSVSCSLEQHRAHLASLLVQERERHVEQSCHMELSPATSANPSRPNMQIYDNTQLLVKTLRLWFITEQWQTNTSSFP